MDGQRRRELTDSARLALHGERWFLLDVVLGVVGFVGWVAASGALVALGAREAGVSTAIEPGSTRAIVIVAVALVGWLLVPAIAGAWRLRERVTNVNGNVEGAYRFESPGTLLVPPFVLVAIAALGVVVTPLKWPAFAVAFVVGAYLLVRTAAFSYRVFAFSRPLVVHAASFCTFLLYGTVGVTQLASVVGSESIVGNASTVLGLPVDVYGTVGVGPTALPLAMTVAAATPVVLAVGYLAGQLIEAEYVRQSEPVIDNSSLRAGQRNPFQPTAANGAGGSVGRSPGSGSTDAATGTAEPSAPVHVQTTRVYAPDEDVADRAGIESGSTDRGGQQCRTCGAGFTAGTEVRFCPNCGQRLDDG